MFDPGVVERARAADDPAARLIARLPDRFERFSPLGKAQYVEIQTFLEGYLLHSQGDRMLMGHSIEGRFPFLDYRVAEFAAALPDRLRLRGLEEKYALRRRRQHVPARGGLCAPQAPVPGADRPCLRRRGRARRTSASC